MELDGPAAELDGEAIVGTPPFPMGKGGAFFGKM